MKKIPNLPDFTEEFPIIAKQSILSELYKTHGLAFASAFLQEFRVEIVHAYEMIRHE